MAALESRLDHMSIKSREPMAPTTNVAIPTHQSDPSPTIGVPVREIITCSNPWWRLADASVAMRNQLAAAQSQM